MQASARLCGKFEDDIRVSEAGKDCTAEAMTPRDHSTERKKSTR
jgi:hypothetical protein